MPDISVKNHAAFIWSVADLLRGDYKQSDYGKVILPLTVMRRLDCVLEPTKKAVLERLELIKDKVDNVEPVLCAAAGQSFCNTSPLDFTKLLDDPNQIAGNLRSYIAGFSQGAQDVVSKFAFEAQIDRLDNADLLYMVVAKFAEQLCKLVLVKPSGDGARSHLEMALSALDAAIAQHNEQDGLKCDGLPESRERCEITLYTRTPPHEVRDKEPARTSHYTSTNLENPNPRPFKKHACKGTSRTNRRAGTTKRSKGGASL